MAFQPFGYRFDLSSIKQIETAKADIRTAKKSWFDPKSGPRGLIAGPFICLWLSAFDRRGPMILGLMARNNFQTRIVGRAGSDLNGVIWFIVLIGVLALITWSMVSDGTANGRSLAIIGFLVFIGFPLTLWFTHTDRKQAEPLVRFLQKTLETKTARSDLRKPHNKELTLNISGQDVPCSPTENEIADALVTLAVGEFVTLSHSDEQYMQVIMTEVGYRLEKREGSAANHFFAECDENGLSAEDIENALIAYLRGQSAPARLKWTQLKL